jgi:hypothetical protein
MDKVAAHAKAEAEEACNIPGSEATNREKTYVCIEFYA